MYEKYDDSGGRTSCPQEEITARTVKGLQTEKVSKTIASPSHRSCPKIKICGLRRPEDISIVNEVMPEYAGFILAFGRRRTISAQQMASLSSGLNPGIRRVAVFLDQDPEWIEDLAKQDLMDVIQLHGKESGEVIRRLRERTGKVIVKAFRIDTMEDVRRAQESEADRVLLDHGAGGSGEAFDWGLIRPLSRPFFLAGGLTPDNVQEAVAQTSPMAVDVSSGVETDHVKDAQKVRRFVEQVRHSGWGC